VPLRARRVLIEGGEALDPVEDRRGVDVDAPFSQQFHDVGVGQTDAEIPAHGKSTDVVGEAVTTEGRNGPRGLPTVTGGALVHLPLLLIETSLAERLAAAPHAPHHTLPFARHPAHRLSYLTLTQRHRLDDAGLERMFR